MLMFDITIRHPVGWLRVFAICLAGCHQTPARVRPPSIDAAAAAKKAIERYDTDDDRLLNQQELGDCAGILLAIDLYDANQDGLVDADELAERIRQWQKTRYGIMPFFCRFRLDGAPLAGAAVKFIPEEFLGQSIKSGVGTSDTRGNVSLSIDPADLPLDDQDLHGLQLGLYKIEVTHPERMLPERYNVRTELGCEVSPQIAMNPPMFDLSSQ